MHATIARSLKLGFWPVIFAHVPDCRAGLRAGRAHCRCTDLEWEFVDSTYVNRGNGTYSESRNLVDYKYLVTEELPSISWQLVGDERTYLDYRVMKAAAVVDSAVVEAWFTPEIPVPAGPGLYQGLPGLILMVTNVTIGEVYAAEFIDMDTQSSKLMPPIIGREVSSDKYDQRVAREIAENQRVWEAVSKVNIGKRMRVGKIEF